MQESRNMDVKLLEDEIKELPESGSSSHQRRPQLDSSSALQMFLDRIPIDSILGIKNSPIVELKAKDTIRDAIQLLYEKNVSGAPISDVLDPDNSTIGRISDRYMGFIDLARLVLWSLEECKKSNIGEEGYEGEETSKNSIFTMLDRNPKVALTKVGELAKSFLWDPFFPVHLDDTLLRVLLLFSKHRLQVVPVIERCKPELIGFVTQDVVVQSLLQSSGLEWFDSIASRPLSEFRFEEKDQQFATIYEKQSLEEALHKLWESKMGAVAVLNEGSGSIIGVLRNSDVYLLLEIDELYAGKRNLAMGDFIHVEVTKAEADPTIERNLGAPFSAGVIRLSNRFLPKRDSPITIRGSSTLKQAMDTLAEMKSNFGFLVDELNRPTGVVTLRDIIIQFVPPCIDSSIHGGGFFEFALEQTGSHIKDGTLYCDR